MDNGDFKKEMKKSLEQAARTYKAAKEMEQAALKMKRLADDLLAQVEKTMQEFKISGSSFLESYENLKASDPKETPSPAAPITPATVTSIESIVIKRKNVSQE